MHYIAFLRVPWVYVFHLKDWFPFVVPGIILKVAWVHNDNVSLSLARTLISLFHTHLGGYSRHTHRHTHAHRHTYIHTHSWYILISLGHLTHQGQEFLRNRCGCKYNKASQFCHYRLWKKTSLHFHNYVLNLTVAPLWLDTGHVHRQLWVMV